MNSMIRECAAIRESLTKGSGGRKCSGRFGMAAMVCVMIIMLLCAPVRALAEENTFTVSLVPSSDHVLPGETFQLYVVIGNDGWPDTGEVEVASFQAHLSYDKEKVSYQDMAVNQGTFAQFEEKTGLIAGFGDKQVFEKDLDFAVLTMKMADNAEGDVSFALDGLVMGKQDASELSGLLAPGITVVIGNGGESASHYAGNGGGSLGAGTVGIYGLDNPLKNWGSGSSGTGSSSGQAAKNGGTSGGNSASDQGGASDGTVQPGTAGSGGQETADGSPSDGSAQTADGTENPDGKAGNASEDTHGSPLSTIAGILAVLAAAAAGAAYILKSRKKPEETQTEEKKNE